MRVPRSPKWLVLGMLVPLSVAAMAADEVQKPASSSYQINGSYAIEGDGGWDYISLDSASRRLYVSHDTELQILDADSGKFVGRVADTRGIHGVAIARELKRGFTSNGGGRSVTIFDTETLKTIKTVSLNSEPDFILYDSFSKRVFALSEKTSVLEASGDIAGELDLGGSPEAAVSDGKGTVYANVASKNSVAVIDTQSLTITRAFPVQNCISPHSISYDAAGQRLLVGCRNGLLVALDAATGKSTASSIMCSWVDSGAWDPDTKLIFESCAEGVVSVIRQLSPDAYDLVDTIKTEFGAKTMAFDAKTKKLFLPTATFEVVTDTERRGAFRRRLKPGSFHVLVVSP